MIPGPDAPRDSNTSSGTTSGTPSNTASRYERAVLASQPIAYWRMGEAKGPSIIDSINGHNGTLHGTPSLQETGALAGDPNTAILLDGQGSYIEMPSHQDFSQCTSGEGLSIEAWLRPDLLEFEGESTDPYIHWLAKGCMGQQEWALRFYSAKSMRRPNRISAYIFNPSGRKGVGAYFQDELIAGEWIHVVACFDPGNADTQSAGVSIYKNGKRRLGPPYQSTLYNNPPLKLYPMPGVAPLRLGTRDLKHCLVGALDEVALYPRVLTANEVWDHFQLGSGVLGSSIHQ